MLPTSGDQLPPNLHEALMFLNAIQELPESFSIQL